MSYRMTIDESQKTMPMQSFNRAQYEVVNMLSCLGDASDCRALKSLLVKFIDSRLQKELDRMYDDGELSDDKLDDLSHRHLRTPYLERA